MIKSLQQHNTALSELHNVVVHFFNNLETAVDYSELFPDWFDTTFEDTDLEQKFTDIFDEYKLITDDTFRVTLISNLTALNEVKAICTNDLRYSYRTLSQIEDDLTGHSENLAFLIHELFQSLYNSYLEYHKFEDYAGLTVRDYIDDYLVKNDLSICPFCGIEGYHLIEGQNRLALDHWFCHSKFPFSAVNFDNLVPMGHNCNSRKSDRIVCEDFLSNRIRGFYPFEPHSGIKVSFRFFSDPVKEQDYKGSNWELKISPRKQSDMELFVSWMELFNIQERLESFMEKVVFRRWIKNFKVWLEDNRKTTITSVKQLKSNLVEFKTAFPTYDRDGAILFHAFIDYLRLRASTPYLQNIIKLL